MMSGVIRNVSTPIIRFPMATSVAKTSAVLSAGSVVVFVVSDPPAAAITVSIIAPLLRWVTSLCTPSLPMSENTIHPSRRNRVVREVEIVLKISKNRIIACLLSSYFCGLFYRSEIFNHIRAFFAKVWS